MTRLVTLEGLRLRACGRAGSDERVHRTAERRGLASCCGRGGLGALAAEESADRKRGRGDREHDRGGCRCRAGRRSAGAGAATGTNIASEGCSRAAPPEELAGQPAIPPANARHSGQAAEVGLEPRGVRARRARRRGGRRRTRGRECSRWEVPVSASSIATSTSVRRPYAPVG